MFKLFLALISLSVINAEATDDLPDTQVDQAELPVVDEDDLDDEEIDTPLTESPSFEDDENLSLALDAQFSENQKNGRMRKCLDIVRSRMSDPKVEELAEVMKNFGIEGKKAAEYAHMEILKNCYIKINQEEVDSGKVAQTDFIFDPPASPRTLHQSQWERLSSILKAESVERKPKVKVIGGNMTNWMRVLYMFVVLAGVFGAGYWVLFKLTKAERERAERKEAKKAKKRD